MRVGVFCSALATVKPEWLTYAYETGVTLAQHYFEVIYGGTNKGMMRSIADGVLDSNGSIHSIISENLHQPHLLYDRIEHHQIEATMIARTQAMLSAADVCLALPGGIGTISEVTQLLTEQRTKTEYSKPLVLLGPTSFWTPLLDLITHLQAATVLRHQLFYQHVEHADGIATTIATLYDEHQQYIQAQ